MKYTEIGVQRECNAITKRNGVRSILLLHIIYCVLYNVYYILCIIYFTLLYGRFYEISFTGVCFVLCTLYTRIFIDILSIH